MKYIFYIILLSCFVSYAQDEPSLGIRGGYVFSNALVPSGIYVLYSDGIPVEKNKSFDYKTGYQAGISFKYPFEKLTLEIAATYVTNGFKDGGIAYTLDYLDVDGTALAYIKESPAFVGAGIGYSFLVDYANIDVTNKYDVRINAVAGVRIIDNLSVFAQGKLGLINVEAASELSNYMFSLNLEYLFF